MAREATGGDMPSPWSDGDDDDRNCILSDGGAGRSVSGVTEVESSGNAAAKARWGGNGKNWLSTLIATEGEEEAEDAGDEEEENCAASSPVWLVAARLGWLLLGFLAGAAMATTVLLVKYDGYPEICIVPT